jgi:hypothetical protein
MTKLDKAGARHNRNVHNKRVGKSPVNESKTSLPNRSEVSEKVAGDRHVWGDKEHKHLKVPHFKEA